MIDYNDNYNEYVQHIQQCDSIAWWLICGLVLYRIG